MLFRRQLTIWLLLFVVTLASSPAVFGQIRIFGRRGTNPDGTSDVSDDNYNSKPPSDRESELLLRRAKEAIQQGRVTEGLEALQHILSGKRSEEATANPNTPKANGTESDNTREDILFQDEKKVWRSLKVAALEQIAALPDDVRQRYEEMYGPAAKRMLDEAIANGDVAALERVARLYLHTPAGRESCILLGQYSLDQDQPLQAALCLNRLKDSKQTAKLEPMLSLTLAYCWQQGGQPERAKEILAALKAKYGKSGLTINDKSLAWFTSDAEANSWLTKAMGELRPTLASETAQWLIFRGNANRNAVSTGGTPILKHSWFVPTTGIPEIEKVFEAMRKRQRESALGVQLPATHALALWDAQAKRDLVLMRTEKSLMAIDMRTGKRIWMFPPEVFEKDATPRIDPNSADNFNQVQQRQIMRMAMMNQGMAMPPERLYESATYGTCASDGKFVYLVHEPSSTALLSAGQNWVGMRRVIMANGGNANANQLTPSNKLVALDINSEGKTMWMVGGDKGEAEPRLAGAYFLGPPLPLMGQLYCLVEMNGSIQLVVLDPKKSSNQLVWSQTLAELTDGGNFDGGRRSAGVSPSFADGVLICPTAADAIVAVDLASRMILWSHRYQSNPGNVYNGGMVFINGVAQDPNNANGNTRWSDGCATVAEGHVIVTPSESTEMFCISLVDGKLEWKRKKDDGLYVACVHKGKVAIVTSKGIELVKIANGEPAVTERKSLAFPGGAAPSGRGVYTGSHYYVPLSTAGICRVDLDAWQIKDTLKSREGFVPGNLVTYKDLVISHGADVVQAFKQLEPLKAWIDAQLKERPDDPEALTKRGEILLADGQAALALKDLQKAYAMIPRDKSAEVRDLLIESILTLLGEDYAKNRTLVAEVEKLIELPGERAKFLRIAAPGEFKSGNTSAAVKAYLELAELDGNRNDLDSIDANLEVRRDRWIQGQLAALISSASPADQESISSLISERLQKVAKIESADKRSEQLRRFLSYFGAHPLGDDAREQLTALLTSSATALEKEQLLQVLMLSTNPERQRNAVARSAQLLADNRRFDDAAVYYRRLNTEFADKVCLGEKTGREIYESLPTDSPIRAKFSGSKSLWPTGAVTATTGNEPADRFGVRQYYPLEFKGPRGPFQDTLSVSYDQQQFLIGRDGMGQRRWRVNLLDNDKGRIQNQYGFMQGMNHVQTFGHLVIANIGMHVVAVDTLASDGRAEGARVLWVAPLYDEILGQAIFNRGFGQMQVTPAWGGPPRYVTTDGATGQPFGGVGRVSSAGFCIQRGRDLVCLDPYSGETLWVRHGIPNGCEIFGDEQYTIAVSANGKGAVIVRTSNGELIGNQDLAPREQRWATLGRNILTWQAVNGKVKITLVDTCGDDHGKKSKEVWSREFDMTAKGAIAGGEEIAIQETSGKFVLLKMATGQPLIETKLETESSLAAVYIFRSSEQYLLVSSQINGQAMAVDNNNRRNFQPPMGEQFTPLVSGHVYAFDRTTGKMCWLLPVEVQRHGLILNQPVDMPVLTFIRHSFEQTKVGGGAQMRSNILCLDKRDGRAAYVNDGLTNHSLHMFDVSSDVEAKTVKMVYQGTQSITLKFTEEPRPPEPPYQASSEAAAPKGLADAANAVGNAVGRVIFGRGKIGIPVQPAQEAEAATEDAKPDAKKEEPKKKEEVKKEEAKKEAEKKDDQAAKDKQVQLEAELKAKEAAAAKAAQEAKDAAVKAQREVQDAIDKAKQDLRNETPKK